MSKHVRFTTGAYATYNEWGFGIMDPDEPLPAHCKSGPFPSPLYNTTAPAWATCQTNLMLRQYFLLAAIRDPYSKDGDYIYAGKL